MFRDNNRLPLPTGCVILEKLEEMDIAIEILFQCR